MLIMTGIVMIAIAALSLSFILGANSSSPTAKAATHSANPFGGTTVNPAWNYSQLVSEAAKGNVKSIVISGSTAVATATSGAHYDVNLPDTTSDLAKTLDSEGVQVTFATPSAFNANTIIEIGLLLLLVGLIIWFFRRMRTQASPAGGPGGFGLSKAKLFDASHPAVTFADVAGCDEAKHELTEIVEFLKHPAKFAALGARIPRGVLLVGLPGVGKTLLAKAVAGESGATFYSISGSEFVEMFVGVGASRVRDLFDKAKKKNPAIVFVDEIDAVGRQRGAGMGGGGGHDEREQTLNQLLVEMDGFDTHTHVIVIAATNRPDVLDPALLRPGRFDRHVTLDRPDLKGRQAILVVHSKDKPLDEDVNLAVVAGNTSGLSGADLANLLNEAAILAARANRKTITMADIEDATMRVIAGPEKKSRIISDPEKAIIAHHETGHALVMKLLPGNDPVTKVSITSRGMALGLTLSTPTEDRYLISKKQVEARIAGVMGGRAAEFLIFGDITSGAENDLKKATEWARRMVTEWGMSEKLGQVALTHASAFSNEPGVSEAMAEEIDNEIRSIVNAGYQTALGILTEHRAAQERIASKLIQVESIDGAELQALFANV